MMEKKWNNRTTVCTFRGGRNFGRRGGDQHFQPYNFGPCRRLYLIIVSLTYIWRHSSLFFSRRRESHEYSDHSRLWIILWFCLQSVCLSARQHQNVQSPLQTWHRRPKVKCKNVLKATKWLVWVCTLSNAQPLVHIQALIAINLVMNISLTYWSIKICTLCVLEGKILHLVASRSEGGPVPHPVESGVRVESRPPENYASDYTRTQCITLL